MYDIVHKVGIKSPPTETFKALTEQPRLAGWWTTDTQGSFEVGGVIAFRFADRGFIDMKVIELDPGKRVVWQVVDGPGGWIGSKVSFDLKPENGYTEVFFKHAGWKEQGEFMHHCSTKWAVFVMSLKSLLETGKGTPDPIDVKIDNWN